MTRLAQSSVALLILSVLTSGCGYNLRGNTRPFFDVKNIRTLYVPPVKNNSFKAGVELTVYNALRKRMSQGGYVRVVDLDKEADAAFEAEVTEAKYTPAGITSADQLAPNPNNNNAPRNVQIASNYSVSLRVKFMLRDKEKKVLWGSELSRTKSFPATTYLGSQGSTSALINEGEFERTLSELSVSIVTDAEESINTIF